MEILAVSIDSILNILYVALGLGLVIFFHELGHFAVAKWCDVNVERFSIGFGPILWSKTWGETEYALSLIPFGGYVKMLGQDDADPSQLTSEEIAQDPRSFSAKPVWQRMAIISAGVTMNVITALLFFAIAFAMGVKANSPDVGGLTVGMPAWQAGMQSGDRIVRIDDREVSTFGDIMRGVALSNGPIDVYVQRGDEHLKMTVHPDESGTRRIIGVEPSHDLKLVDLGSKVSHVVHGSPAAAANPPFAPGDVIKRVNETDVSTFLELETFLSRHRSEPIDFWVEREGQDKLTKITVQPTHFGTLGLWMDFGQITVIQDGAPAAKEDGLKVGDKIISVNGNEVGTKIDPLALPDYFASLHGQDVEVKVKRQMQGSGSREVTVILQPADRPGWVEGPGQEGEPLSIPSIGVAFHVTPTVMKVEADGPAAGKIQEGDSIKQIDLVLPPGKPEDLLGKEDISIALGADQKNWAYAFWLMQKLPNREARLTISEKDGDLRSEPIVIKPQPKNGWYMPTRGIRLFLNIEMQRATGIGDSFSLALTHTQNSITDIYLTLRNLGTGRLSVKELRGPIGIAMVAYEVTQQGLSDLLLFLGFLSVNLAVLNFLPIPVLDGGHMVFLIWEGVTRRKPSERVLIAATYCGMAFVLGLMALVLYLDVFVHGMMVQ